MASTQDGYVGSSEDGRRIARLSKQRQKEREAFEEQKRKFEDDAKKGVQGINEKFGSGVGHVYEQQLVKETIGLVSIENFKKKRETIEELHAAEVEKTKIAEQKASDEARKKRREEAAKRRPPAKLSFDLDGPEEGGTSDNTASGDEGLSSGNESSIKKKLKKNPDVDTSFLPDRDREQLETREREQLKREFLEKQDKEKRELLEITYSYWDGTGHRRNIKVNKGTTIEGFLEKVRKDLADEFRELRGCSVENLLYIKEDLIVPHHYTFYDLIISKARGKSGPLFHFDVHDDIRTLADARVEKDESHAGKIVERHWYERNKHIFPASRWEVYDPEKKFEKYTIHDSSKGV
mmetsp:Transcript_27517/g.44766  ORF Transcript_27517/g.44766 Transcript_27517/m.44766 type:complete len:350 (-) Transcript_27517:574-1623(-)|eukprot:CAMPEP_0184651426 /NCGR_PEP_ID=MMETSP0308-20130426/9024_1 /TAXON_ID=38269 /ORGANISM="Gloeochaete witrockiana, Strain SAG 46.84" /LENGTH=349 /DNA_ID=CAMNT_0027085625 /DNA_START=22 /DNA_END=1071 /DNA_ORIENTATION=-